MNPAQTARTEPPPASLIHRTKHCSIQPQERSQPDNSGFKCQTQEPVVGNERPAEEMGMGQGLISNTKKQIPRVIGEERGQTPPVVPSTAGRQVWITPEIQQSSHSPIEEVKHDQGRYLINQKYKPCNDEQGSRREPDSQLSLQDQENCQCNQDVGPAAA
jgi:hypothetical protein